MIDPKASSKSNSENHIGHAHYTIGKEAQEAIVNPIVINGVEIPLNILCQKTRRLYFLADIYYRDPALPVLLQGETGTGKELIAKTIHYGLAPGSKGNGNFIAINCAAISPGLFESELFGYEPGAFTGGLAKGQLGKMDLAQNGTLFFDEISELPLGLQGKLLRVLQEKEYYRVGGLRKVKFKARVICATNEDLAERVQQRLFRRDLFYRFNVAQMVIPPLRERKEEIIPLANFFLHKFSELKGKHFHRIEVAAEKLLRAYDWPGNIRELQNIMNHLTTRYDGGEVKSGQFLELYPALLFRKGQCGLPENKHATPGKTLKEYVNEVILQTLKKNAGNKSVTAKQLGISRHVLYNFLQKMKQE